MNYTTLFCVLLLAVSKVTTELCAHSHNLHALYHHTLLALLWGAWYAKNTYVRTYVLVAFNTQHIKIRTYCNYLRRCSIPSCVHGHG